MYLCVGEGGGHLGEGEIGEFQHPFIVEPHRL